MPSPVITTNHRVEVASADRGESGIFTAARVDLALRWNGYLAAPMFTLAEVHRVIAYFNDPAWSDGHSALSYHEATDSVVFVDGNSEDDEAPQVWPGFDVDGQHLYTIGDGWCWSSYQEDRSTGVVSAPVARQMLYLLGDNEHWSERPSPEDMSVWATIRNASPNELEVLATYYPEQCEAYKHALKHWGLDWLRGIVEKAWAAAGERLDAIAAEAAL